MPLPMTTIEPAGGASIPTLRWQASERFQSRHRRLGLSLRAIRTSSMCRRPPCRADRPGRKESTVVQCLQIEPSHGIPLATDGIVGTTCDNDILRIQLAHAKHRIGGIRTSNGRSEPEPLPVLERLRPGRQSNNGEKQGNRAHTVNVTPFANARTSPIILAFSATPPPPSSRPPARAQARAIRRANARRARRERAAQVRPQRLARSDGRASRSGSQRSRPPRDGVVRAGTMTERGGRMSKSRPAQPASGTRAKRGACTPGSVASSVSLGPVAIHLGPSSPTASSSYPRNWERAAPVPFRAVRCSPCTWWGLPCLSCCQESGGLLHRRFTLACDPFGSIGGLFSVALSVASPRPDVIWHHYPAVPGSSSGFLQRPPGPPLVPGGQSYFTCPWISPGADRPRPEPCPSGSAAAGPRGKCRGRNG